MCIRDRNRAGVPADQVDQVYMGCVIQAGQGQNVARQASIKAGLPIETPAVTINVVCGSGLNCVNMAAEMIAAGDADIVVAGGMENMSMAPYAVMQGRYGYRMNDGKLVDTMVHDALWDAFNDYHMGITAENIAEEWGLTRQQLDEFAAWSQNKCEKARAEGKFKDEIVPVEVPQRRGDAIVVSKDEEYTNVKLDKIPSLAAVFTKEGTVTAANASTINDGAAALVLMSEEKAQSLGLTPLAYIKSYADAAQEPKWFTTAPAKALPKALAKAGISISDVDFFEFNEAFSVVGLANAQILGLDNDKINVNGGAVSLGHPLGCSGARIIVTLISVLNQNNAKIGAAAICNGGGGASAIVIERA